MIRAERSVFSIVGLLALAAFLRFAGLDRQLWLDEIDALVLSQRRPLSSIIREWPAGTGGLSGSAHVFYDLLAHASLRTLGESPFAARLPAALFGVLAVAGLFGLVRDRFSHREAFASALLLAVSVPHVFQSQNARGYTALLFLAILSSWLLLRMQGREREGRSQLAAYAASVALAAWSVPFGVFLLAGHALALLVVARHRDAERGSWPHRSWMVAAGGAALLILVLYAPLLGSTAAVAAEQSRLPTAGTGAVYRLGVVRTGLLGLFEGLGGPWSGTVLLGVSGLGVAWWCKRDVASLAVLALPVLTQGAVLLALDVPLNPRYFVLALAVLIVGLALGVSALATAAGRLVPKTTDLVRAGLLVVVVLASVPALVRYYRVPKQDFQGAIAEARALAGPGDHLVAVHHAGRVLHGYYQAGFEDVQTLEQLENIEALGGRLLLVTTLERFLAVQVPDLDRHIRNEYRKLATLDATVVGAEMVLYERVATGGSLGHP